MGNHHVNVMCTSLKARVFIVTFNNSDVVYWHYRELRHVARNKKVRVSGILAGGYVKVGVVYGGMAKNEQCFYDLFRVRSGAMLVIEAVSPVDGVLAWSVVPEGWAKLLDCGRPIRLKPDAYQLIAGTADADSSASPLVRRMREINRAAGDLPPALTLARCRRLLHEASEVEDARTAAGDADTLPLLPPVDEDPLRVFLSSLDIARGSRPPHPSLVPSECQDDETAKQEGNCGPAQSS